MASEITIRRVAQTFTIDQSDVSDTFEQGEAFERRVGHIFGNRLQEIALMPDGHYYITVYDEAGSASGDVLIRSAIKGPNPDGSGALNL